MVVDHLYKDAMHLYSSSVATTNIMVVDHNIDSFYRSYLSIDAMHLYM